MKREQAKGRETGRVDVDEILPEYDFSRAGPNKYASRYAAGSVVVVSIQMWLPCFQMPERSTRRYAL
jgi:hypothetical protein